MKSDSPEVKAIKRALKLAAKRLARARAAVHRESLKVVNSRSDFNRLTKDLQDRLEKEGLASPEPKSMTGVKTRG